MTYKIAKAIAWMLFKPYFRLTGKQLEHIPESGPFLIVANHTSFLDPLVIGTLVPRRIHFITYAFFYHHPMTHWFCKRTYCIPVKKEGNDASALKKALRLLKHGEIVGIFPEGERSKTGRLLPAAPGTALIALKAGVPILPAGIHGAYQAFPRGATFPKPVHVTVTFGTPFLLEDHIHVGKKPSGEIQQQATQLIMRRIAELCQPDSVNTGKVLLQA